MKVPRISLITGLACLAAAEGLAQSGCAIELAARPEQVEVQPPLVFGRAVALLTGESSRAYEPQVRFFEVMNRESNECFSVGVRSDDTVFVLPLPAGDYTLTRVQISEGPFMSMADYDATFHVGGGGLTYVGTWRFGVDSPRYGRMMVVSAIQDQQDQALAEQTLIRQFPHLQGQSVTTELPNPVQAESRLYEVMPYPRYPRYFRRHWW